MLEMAREHFPSQCWIEADMRSVNLNRCFDGILAWDSFFHLTPNDQRWHVREICAVVYRQYSFNV